ncbi:MAG: DUF2207 domain-containing protein [Chloroflexi bacterium]|nr:DUF2207 domain-containing protein [Chloroflexota bacterium]
MIVRLGLAALLIAAFLAALPSVARADEGWVIRSFDVEYEIDDNGVVHVTEDILVDFGSLQRHGIFREMPTLYSYDEDNDRRISVSNVGVDDGQDSRPGTLISSGSRLQIKIGDPNVLISGEQRYRISYLLTGALNAFPDHDEFFWNVTGDDWPVPIESATASVFLPAGGVDAVDCFRGRTGSTDTCEADFVASSATFSTTRGLASGSGMTIVVGIEKGAVEVASPVLQPIEPDTLDEIEDAFDITPWTVGAALAVFFVGLAAVGRQWWMQGRDRWYGEVWYLNDGENVLAKRKPLFAREAVLTEYEPPPLKKNGRQLRPAEIGVLMDESADTLDITATIIDLAVRKYIRIKETTTSKIFGLFKSTDHEIERLRQADDDLLPYERQTLKALFKGQKSKTVKLSALRTKFYKDLAKIKEALYDQMVKKDGLFPGSPTKARTIYQIAGAVVIGAGIALGAGLWAVGWVLVAIPVVLVGIVLLLVAPAMPRRTGKGRRLYQRAVGFRRFMVTAETERQRFAERTNIFHEYLPYAIIYGCVDKWAHAFEGLGEIEQPGWYVGAHPFVAASFINSVNGFSASVSSSIASSPGGSGGSGFGGGGFSGGGGGGGGGGSW